MQSVKIWDCQTCLVVVNHKRVFCYWLLKRFQIPFYIFTKIDILTPTEQRNVSKWKGLHLKHKSVFWFYKFFFFLNSSKDTTRLSSGTVFGFSSNGNSMSVLLFAVCGCFG